MIDFKRKKGTTQESDSIIQSPAKSRIIKRKKRNSKSHNSSYNNIVTGNEDDDDHEYHLNVSPISKDPTRNHQVNNGNNDDDDDDDDGSDQDNHSIDRMILDSPDRKNYSGSASIDIQEISMIQGNTRVGGYGDQDQESDVEVHVNNDDESSLSIVGGGMDDTESSYDETVGPLLSNNNDEDIKGMHREDAISDDDEEEYEIQEDQDDRDEGDQYSSDYEDENDNNRRNRKKQQQKEHNTFDQQSQNLVLVDLGDRPKSQMDIIRSQLDDDDDFWVANPDNDYINNSLNSSINNSTNISVNNSFNNTSINNNNNNNDNNVNDNDNNNNSVNRSVNHTTPFGLVKNKFHQARGNLHISVIPENLPCREREKDQITQFLISKLTDNSSGGCLYVAGMPGTGKTTTVKEVIKCLQGLAVENKVNKFDYIEINGMELVNPQHLYIALYKKISKRSMKQRLSSTHAHQLLKNYFSSKTTTRSYKILVVDEFDQLITKKQTVIYNLFEWPTKPKSKLIVIAISNTMNLPDDLLPRVQSRMGLKRISFISYTSTQLATIIKSRLKGLEAFDKDAINVCSAKVAGICGDARRALDICRMATIVAENEWNATMDARYKQLLQQQQRSNNGEDDDNNVPIIPEQQVTVEHIEKVMDLHASPVTDILQGCTLIEKCFLYAYFLTQRSSGISSNKLGRIVVNMLDVCHGLGLDAPTPQQIIRLLIPLTTQHIILLQDEVVSDSEQLIRLNVSMEELLFALNRNHRFEQYIKESESRRATL